MTARSATSIPDGYWRGYVRSWDGADVEQSSTLQFELICVYLSPPGDVNEGVYLDGWLVNNNNRTRTVPHASGFFAHGTTFAGDEVYTPFDQPDVPFDPSGKSRSNPRRRRRVGRLGPGCNLTGTGRSSSQRFLTATRTPSICLARSVDQPMDNDAAGVAPVVCDDGRPCRPFMTCRR